MTAENNNRAYVVLMSFPQGEVADLSEEPGWLNVGTWVAANGEQAVRKAVSAKEWEDGDAGVYKAVPDRSWDPTYDVTVSTRPVIDLETRKER
jgi:hypothetical protein